MPLHTHVLRPSLPADALFLFIHGKGADEHDLEPLVPHLDPSRRLLVVLPRAPLALPPGYQWYGTEEIPAGGPEFATSVDALDDLLDAVCAEEGFERSRTIVGGFSQGAALALALGLRAGDRTRPGAVLAMSGFLVQRPDVVYDFAAPPPVLVQHGTSDPLIPVEFGRAAADTLAGAGVPVVYREYPMAHQVALESVGDAAVWLARVLAGERPTGGAPAGEPPEGHPPPEPDELVPSVDTLDFERVVLESDVPVIVDFWAPWCQPCRQVSPVVEQIAAMRRGSYRVVKVNIDEEPGLAQMFGVQSIPMVALFRNGRMERQATGAKARPVLEAELGMLVVP